MSILKKIKEEKLIKTDNAKLIIGNVWTKISGSIPKKVINEIDDELSYFVQGAQFSKAYRDKNWDGFKRFLVKQSLFPTGFLNDVCKIIKKNKIKVIKKDTRKKYEISEEEIIRIISTNKKITARKYQVKAVIRIINKQSGVANLPTGTGKTEIINLVIFVLDTYTKKKLKYLVISGGISLLSQLKESIGNFQNEKIGFIGSGIKEIKRITVGSVDSLYPHSIKKFKKYGKNSKTFKIDNEIQDLLQTVNVVFLDEAHHSPADTFRSVLNSATNASFRIGTTATYERADGEDMLLRAVTGSIIYKKSLSWMIEKGYLANPIIILFTYNGAELKEKKGDTWKDSYKDGVSQNKHRNILISNINKILIDKKLSSVLFVEQLNQGQDITKHMINNLRVDKNSISFLTGKSNLTLRKQVLNNFSSGEIRTIVCTKILNEGIDFPEANAGIKASGMKFEGTIKQQLGRILRKKKNKFAKDIDRKESQNVFWIDICDVHSSILANHSLKRIKVYESEPIFKVIYVSSLNELKDAINDNIKKTKIIKDRKNSSDKKNSSNK